MDYTYIFWPVFLLLGLVVGSFLNVCIYRIPKNITVAKGFSMCPACLKRLLPMELVPVLSYIFLGGKCRHCSARISFVYPIVELITGALFVLVYMVYGFSLYTALALVVGCTVITAAFIDINTLEIPDGASIIIAVAGLIAFLTPQALWWERLIGVFAGAGPLLIIAIISGGGAMGMGDIKLMAAAGLFLGYKLVLTSLLIAVIFGGVVGAALVLLKIKGRKDEIPFVPMLGFGIIVSMLAGDAIIAWYVALMTF
ncbi:MAG: prepilin peptidase [Christensenellales bacterium]|jgi:leader peptidase (prepilin peptidase)/N-methyltransferase